MALLRCSRPAIWGCPRAPLRRGQRRGGSAGRRSLEGAGARRGSPRLPEGRAGRGVVDGRRHRRVRRAVGLRSLAAWCSSEVRARFRRRLFASVEVSETEDPRLFKALVRWLERRRVLASSGSFRAVAAEPRASGKPNGPRAPASFRPRDDVCLLPLFGELESARFAFGGATLWVTLEGGGSLSGTDASNLRALIGDMRPSPARRAARATARSGLAPQTLRVAALRGAAAPDAVARLCREAPGRRGRGPAPRAARAAAPEKVAAADGPSLSELLNAVDGVRAAADGRILFITTNRVDALDGALRPGRYTSTTTMSPKTPKDLAVALAKFVGSEGKSATFMNTFYERNPHAKAIIKDFGKVKGFIGEFPDILRYDESRGHLCLDIYAVAPRPSRPVAAARPKKAAVAARPPTQVAAQPPPRQAAAARPPADLRSRTVECTKMGSRTLAARLDEAKVPAPGDDEVDLGEFFYGLEAEASREAASRRCLRRATLVGAGARDPGAETALFGRAIPGAHVFLNLADPFCVVALGVQGSGKSHTVATIVESCLMPVDEPADRPLVRLAKPMAVLALHFGKSAQDACELAGLFRPARELATPHRVRPVVLVSPSFYKQRVAYYAGADVEVHPLLFNWASLGAAHLRAIMRLDDEKSQQLYVSVALDLLRRYQQQGRSRTLTTSPRRSTASAARARRRARSSSGSSSSNPCSSRRRATRTTASRRSTRSRSSSARALIVADLTDPLLSAADANGIFQVLLEQFRACDVDAGKLVVLDEAHRYLSGDSGSASAVVDAVRVMRHEALRVVVSTQSPLTLPPEILELASVAVLHAFHSSDWYAYLASKLAIPKDGFSTVRRLDPGDALVFAARADLAPAEEFEEQDGRDCAVIRIRRRLTRDLGASRRPR
ncbi:hypothetical protein JL720_5890 [Aureococcus anophagefferens]|nr:hypothetical protein JL720_5890 [Aureococcus anophagefferens]